MWRFLSLQPPSVGTVATCRASAYPDGRWGAASNQHRCHILFLKKQLFTKILSLLISCNGWVVWDSKADEPIVITLCAKMRLSCKCLERSQDLYKIVYQIGFQLAFCPRGRCRRKKSLHKKTDPTAPGQSFITQLTTHILISINSSGVTYPSKLIIVLYFELLQPFSP